MTARDPWQTGLSLSKLTSIAGGMNRKLPLYGKELVEDLAVENVAGPNDLVPDEKRSKPPTEGSSMWHSARARWTNGNLVENKELESREGRIKEKNEEKSGQRLQGSHTISANGQVKSDRLDSFEKYVDPREIIRNFSKLGSKPLPARLEPDRFQYDQNLPSLSATTKRRRIEASVSDIGESESETEDENVAVETVNIEIKDLKPEKMSKTDIDMPDPAEVWKTGTTPRTMIRSLSKRNQYGDRLKSRKSLMLTVEENSDEGILEHKNIGKGLSRDSIAPEISTLKWGESFSEDDEFYATRKSTDLCSVQNRKSNRLTDQSPSNIDDDFAAQEEDPFAILDSKPSLFQRAPKITPVKKQLSTAQDMDTSIYSATAKLSPPSASKSSVEMWGTSPSMESISSRPGSRTSILSAVSHLKPSPLAINAYDDSVRSLNKGVDTTPVLRNASTSFKLSSLTPSVLPAETLLAGSMLKKRNKLVDVKPLSHGFLRKNDNTRQKKPTERKRMSHEGSKKTEKEVQLPHSTVKRLWTNLLKTSEFGSFGKTKEAIETVEIISKTYFQHAAHQLTEISRRNGRSRIRLEDGLTMLESNGTITAEPKNIRSVITKHLPKEFADKVLSKVLD